MYNVILFTDAPIPSSNRRGFGAYRLASEIRKNGYTVLVVDCCAALTMEEYCKIIDAAVNQHTLMIGFSTSWFPAKKDGPAMLGAPDETGKCFNFDLKDNSWYYNGLSYNFSKDSIPYTSYIKLKNSNIKVVVGGYNAEQYITDHVDNVFIGFSENQAVDYLNSLTKGPKRIFNKIINYDVKSQIGNFDFKTSQTSYADTDSLSYGEVLQFEFARGCIFNCKFCFYPHKNQKTKDYTKYAEVIREELLNNYNRWGLYQYMIMDDTFNDYTEKLEVIRDIIKTLPFKPEFWAYCRIDLFPANPTQPQLLKEIGIKEVFYGLETWNEDTAKAISKGNKNSRKIEGFKLAKECWGDEVSITTNIVVGLPHDTVQSIIDSVEWYQQEGHKYVDAWYYGLLDIRCPESQLNLKYKFLSEIEKNLEFYGYSFPDPVNEPRKWVRSGPGDITSAELAHELSLKADKAVRPYFTSSDRRRFTDRFPDIPALYPGEDWNSIYYRWVQTKYMPNLFKWLGIN